MKFEEAVKKGGKVKTKTLPRNRYQRSCTLNGKTYMDEVKKKKAR